jgi:hypothetical protein
MEKKEIFTDKEVQEYFGRGATWTYCLRKLGCPMVCTGRYYKHEVIEFVRQHPNPRSEYEKKFGKKPL